MLFSARTHERPPTRGAPKKAASLYSRSRTDAGFTLLESLVAVAMAAMFLAVYTSMLTSTFFLRRTASNIQATNLIQEELDALRTVDFDAITLRTDGAILGVPVQRGDWAVVDASGDKVLRLSSAESSLSGETGLAVLPGNYRDDVTVTASLTIDAASPAGWDAGIGVRYIDSENHYRYRITSGGIAFDVVEQGVPTTLWSSSTSLSTGVEYELQVVASNNTFDLYRDGSLLDTVVDSTYSDGDLTVMALDDALIDVDDVSVDTPSSETWDFESETVGDYPDDWRRVGYADLTDGTGTLTVTEHLAEPSLKEVTVTIGWNDGGFTRSASGTTIISQ